MDRKRSPHTTKPADTSVNHSLGESTHSDVEVEVIETDYDPPIIPADRRLSWAGWLVAIAIFIINRKLGLLFIVLLLIFKQFPTLNLKSVPGKAGKLYKKMRS